MSLPIDATSRKALPITTGVLDFFPDALAAIARVSLLATEQHHPGEPMHWERGKSMDQADCIVRHLIDRGTMDTDGVRHSAKVAWRALALLQQELEDAGAPLSRGSRAPSEPDLKPEGLSTALYDQLVAMGFKGEAIARAAAAAPSLACNGDHGQREAPPVSRGRSPAEGVATAPRRR